MFGERCIFTSAAQQTNGKYSEHFLIAYLSGTNTNLYIIVIQRLSRRQRRRTASFGCTLKKKKIVLIELHFKCESSKDNEKASLWAIFKLEVKRICSLTVTRSWAAKHLQRSGVNFKETTSRRIMLWYIHLKKEITWNILHTEPKSYFSFF